jgi:uncharacterized membrane protein
LEVQNDATSFAALGYSALSARGGRRAVAKLPVWSKTQMRPIAEFVKTTLIGGLLIVLPVYIAVLLILKAIQGLVAAVKPITAIPGSVEFEEILAILVLAVICFIAGLIVRTRAGLRAKNAIERRVLQRLPGYTLLRGLTGRVMGQADDPAFAPCLAEIEEALVPALIVEELENGSFTVLVPSVPTPMAGAVYILPPERVHPVDVPFTAALRVFTKWGAGSGEFVRALEAGKPSQTAPSAA